MVTYPQYRKYPHGRTYFKIISPAEFEELQMLGNECVLHHFTAKILPDRNYIHDLTFDYEKHWVAIEEAEYEEMRKMCRPQKQERQGED
jgi:hypothetical protein